MEKSEILLGWDMTIEQYRNYFIDKNHTEYRTFCKAIYPSRGNVGIMHIAMAFLLNGTAAYNEGSAGLPQRVYLDEVTSIEPNHSDNADGAQRERPNISAWTKAYKNALGYKDSINSQTKKPEAGTIAADWIFGIGPRPKANPAVPPKSENGTEPSSQATGSDAEKKRQNITNDTQWKSDFDARLKKTIYEAYDDFIHTLDTPKSGLQLNAEKRKLLKSYLDKLLTPLDKDLIIDRIHYGGCRQIILTGAPGTGKTYTARELAKEACNDPNPWGASLVNEKTNKKEAYTLVQFHPSYDYTDFVEGLRPVMANHAQGGNQIQFAKMDGTFKAFCRRVVEANEPYLEQIKTEIKTFAANFHTMDAEDKEKNLAVLSKYLYPGEIKKNLDTMHALTAIQAAKPSLSVLYAAVNNFPDTQEKVESWLTELNTAAKEAALLLPDEPSPDLGAKVIASISEIKLFAETLGNVQKSKLDGLFFAMQSLLQNKLLSDASAESADPATINFDEIANTIQDIVKEPFKGKQAPTLNNVFGCDSFDIILDHGRKTLSKAPKQEKKKQEWLGALQDFMEALRDAAPISAQLKESVHTLSQSDLKLETDPLSELTKAIEEDTSILNPSAHPDCKLYFFIIDEINRANLSKVFGELMYCLEKDKRGTAHPPIQTQYHNLPTFDASGTKLADDVFSDGFYIPENVVIIGTMNDIDRSVDSMDFALRRRFEWKEIEVNEATLINAFLSGSYGKVIRDNAALLSSCITALNDHIADKGNAYSLNRQYFISQGQFSNLPANLKTVQEILAYAWEYRIELLLRDYLRGESEDTIVAFTGNNKDKKTVGAYYVLFSKLEELTKKTTSSPKPRKTKSQSGASVNPDKDEADPEDSESESTEE